MQKPLRWLKHITEHTAPNEFTATKAFNQEEDTFKRLLLQPYKKPIYSDLLIIIPFFNPCNSIRITQNLLFVKTKLENAKINHIIVHCIFPNNDTILNESDSYFVLRSTSYAFVKENIANIVIKKHSSTFTKFMILDGDILFENESWYDDTTLLLNTYDIIQPYTTYVTLNSNFSTVQIGQSAFSRKDGHSGYCIAFTINFWNIHGIPDLCLLGGGDRVLCSVVKKEYIDNKTTQSPFHLYVFNKFVNNIPITYNALDGKIFHLYHNNPINRQYSIRYLILNKYLNPNSEQQLIEDIVYKNNDGVYEWIDDIKDNINKDILDYFSSRKDDD
jgi:hypothetical protein